MNKQKIFYNLRLHPIDNKIWKKIKSVSERIGSNLKSAASYCLTDATARCQRDADNEILLFKFA